MNISQNKQSGVASIFIVIFFTLLISLIVLSFVQIVNQDQRQSVNADLSSSAYDSAQAGVEDAKRGLEQYRKNCLKTTTPDGDCVSKYTSTDPTTPGALSGQTCTTFQNRLGSSSDLGLDVDSTSKEVRVTTDTTNDRALNQAYTCLKVSLQTNDYKRTLDNGNTVLFPLKAVSGNPTTIQLNWFEKSQWYDPGTGADLDLPNAVSGNDFDLPKTTGTTGWGSNKPPVMRAQIIAVPRSNINTDEIDNNSRAVFLYPSTAGSNDVNMSNADALRRTIKDSPVAVKCNNTDAYACSVALTNFSFGADYDYYLRLMPTYNGVKLQVKMLEGSTPLKFDGVEPEIDSTGRANDVFRRVITRVAFDGDQNGIDITQGLCKNFRLADGDEYYAFDCDGKNNLVDQ
jgi:Tfp pilus assembly protein PilX